MERVFIGLGSNLGRREEMIFAALEWLKEQRGIEVMCCTELEETVPWGKTDQPSFINAIARIHTTHAPAQLLEILKAGENALGRQQRARWGPREIDMDILLFGDQIVETPTLTIPHARLAERDFVLSQLVDLDRDIVHPATGERLVDILSRLENNSAS